MGYMSLGSLSKNWVINKRNNNSITLEVYCSGSATRYLGNSTYLLELEVEIRNTSQSLVMSAFLHTFATTGYAYYGTQNVTIDINTVAYSFTNNQQLYVQVKNKNDAAEYTTQSSLYVRPVVLNFGTHATAINTEYDKTITLPVPSNPPAGWNLTYNWLYDGSIFGGSTSFDISNYASWFTNTYTINFVAEMNKITYNITMNYNGGIGGGISSSTYQINSSTQLRDLTAPGKAGYTFQGWVVTTNPTGGSISILSNTQLRIESNTYGNFTVSAVYSWNYENQQYAIGVTNNVSPVSYALNEPSYNASLATQQNIDFFATVAEGYTLSYGFEIQRTGTYGGPAPYVAFVEVSSEEVYTYRIVIPAGSYGTFEVYPTPEAIDYTITYNLGGGSGAHGNPASYNVGTPDFNLVQGDLVKTGYTFLGWFTAASGGSQVTTIFQGSTGNITLYAQWTPTEYTISYTLNGSTAYPVSGTPVINPTTYTIESPLITFDSADFSRPGWTFSAFNPATIAAGSTGNKTIVLSWSSINYTITANNNGGSGMSFTAPPFDTPSTGYNSSLNNGSSLTRTITPPTRAGYTVGSYTIIRSGTYGGSTPTVSGNTITIPSGSYGDFTVRANWIGNVNDYTFTSNGGTISSNWITQATPKVFNYSLNSKIGYQPNGGLVTIQTTGGNTTVSGVSALTITVPANAYGQLEVVGQYLPNTYTVAFNSNGGNTLNNLAATYDVNLGTLPTPIRAGYNFDGWYFQPEFTTLVTSTSKNLTTTNGATATLYAKWTARVLTINYAAGSGTGTMTPSTGSYDANVLVKANGFSRVGYTFNGWLNSDTLANATNPTANTEYLVNDLSSTIDDEDKTSETITLTAQWIINQYTISFEENSGSNVSNITQDYNSSVSKPTNPTRIGYTFDNWYTDAALTTVQTWPFNMPVGGKTLYAKWNINQYTIFFIENGGSVVNDITQNYGTTVIQPGDPTKLENVFAGWYLDTGFTQAYTFGTMPANDVTLYAKWNTNEYNLKFVDHDGTVLQSGDYDYGYDLSGVSEPSNPSRTGYTFVNWDMGIPTVMPANNVTITAQYEINQYTISFEENSGTLVDDIIQDYLSSVAKPIDPTRTGYTFNGWYLESNFTTLQTWPFNMPLNGKTLYAKWTINSYTISIYVNGGSVINNIVQNYNTNITAPTNPTRTGYTFDGWYQEPTLVNVYVFPAAMPAFNDEAYAKWTINQYTITFIENGGSNVTDITQNYNSTVVAPTNPTKTGYTFDGWYSDVGLTQAYTFGTMPLNGVTLYAKWNINQYTVSFEENAGSLVDDITEDYNTIIIVPDEPIRTGYTFEGWYQDLELTTVQTWPFNLPAQNITLYAKWTINQYTISFEENGGSLVDDITQNYNTSVSAPTNPTKEGHNFGGWYSDVAFTQAYTFNTMPASDITLYAKWLVDAYTLQYIDWNGAVIQTGDYDFGHDLSTITPPANPNRTGYTFDGWNVILPSTMPANNITVTAVYTINQYTISFEENGGTDVNNITQNYGTSVSAPSISRVGYTFGGWFTNVELTDQYTFTTMPAGNITLYAKWTVNQYTITLVENGGIDLSNIIQNYGTNVATPNITRTGYTFNGWFSNPELTTAYTFTTMPAQNITVYAKWTINKYKVTFIENGGVAVIDLDQNYGTAITLPTITRIGHTFLGWFSDEAMTTAYNYTTIPAQNTTAYAKWQINQYTITFVENIGSNVDDITQNYDTNIVYPTTTRPGYTFGGWFTDAGLSVPNTLTKIPAYNQTLYAKWIGITYTITVNLNGGIGESNKTFTTNPAQQTRNFKVGLDMTKTVIGKKHLFSHWEIVDNTSGTTSVMSGATLTIPANAYGAITLNARWNVAIRKQRVGNTRLEENKLKVGSNSVSKVIITNAAAEPEIIFEKDLYLEDL